jgi:hypothetical protein
VKARRIGKMNMTALLRSATNVINGAKFRLRLSLIEGAG